MRITATPSHRRDGAEPRAAARGSARQRLRRVAPIDGGRHRDDRRQRFGDERSLRGRRRRAADRLRRLSRRRTDRSARDIATAASARSSSAPPRPRPRRSSMCVSSASRRSVSARTCTASSPSPGSSMRVHCRRHRPGRIDGGADLARARALPLPRGGAAPGERRRPHRPLQPSLPRRLTRAAGGARRAAGSTRWRSSCSTSTISRRSTTRTVIMPATSRSRPSRKIVARQRPARRPDRALRRRGVRGADAEHVRTRGVHGRGEDPPRRRRNRRRASRSGRRCV